MTHHASNWGGIDRIDPIRGGIAELRHCMEQRFEKAEKDYLRFLFLAWAVQLAANRGTLRYDPWHWPVRNATVEGHATRLLTRRVRRAYARLSSPYAHA